MPPPSAAGRQVRPPGPTDQVEPPPATALADQGEFLRHSPDLMVVLDGRGRVLRVSRSVERILGYRGHALSHRRLIDLVHPDDAPRVRAAVRKLVEAGAVAEVECRLRHADRRWVPMEWSASLDRRAGRVYGVGRDRTLRAARQEAAETRTDTRLRLTMAGELHDGVLQALTAGSLQIEVARRLIRTDAVAAEDVLRRVAELMTAEQREIRLFVDEMKPEDTPLADRAPLAERIGEMLRRIESIWDVTTDLEARLAEPLGPGPERAVLRIIQEAVVNAVQHGAAANVSVRAVAEQGTVSLRIRDDGRGFPFKGDLDDAELKARRLGPVSLKRRVAEAGGRLAVHSTPQGATLRISLPRPDAST